jgi:hypothetical protein
LRRIFDPLAALAGLALSAFALGFKIGFGCEVSKLSQAAEYHLFTLPGAKLTASLRHEAGKLPEVCVFGNRAGVASLANLFFWLLGNSYQSEVLPVTSLPFVEVKDRVSLAIRLIDGDANGNFGSVRSLDKASQFEWELTEDDLRSLALAVHRLVCQPEHEYDIFPAGEDTEANVHIRLTDIDTWLLKPNSRA